MIADFLEAMSAGHWLAEAVMEVASYLVIGRLFLKWHDRKKHPKPDHRHPIPPHRHFSFDGKQQSGEVDYL